MMRGFRSDEITTSAWANMVLSVCARFAASHTSLCSYRALRFRSTSHREPSGLLPLANIFTAARSLVRFRLTLLSSQSSFLVCPVDCMALFHLTPPEITTRLGMPPSDNEQNSGTLKPPYRVHRKSRKGCTNCKARRVKVPQTPTIPVTWPIQHICLELTHTCLCQV